MLSVFATTNLLPEEYPENTSGYEGFFHLTELSGNVSLCKMKYLIRDGIRRGEK
jgi:di/tripeptidase